MLMAFKSSRSSSSLVRVDYQILHLSAGFILELTGHLNALANSIEFATVPITRKRGGLCWSTDSDRCSESAVDFEHHVYTPTNS